MPGNILQHPKRRSALLLNIGSICSLLLLLIACSGSTQSTGVTSSAAAPQNSSDRLASVSKAAASNSISSSSGQKDPGPQYLIKTLKVTLQVQNTRQVADQLQTWITQTDPLATSSGTDYEDQGNQYNVTFSFSVEASLYPKVYNYLKNYGTQGNTLQSFNETVQDVTNDYVDTASRIANDKVEQKRLQDLMGQATSLSDVLTLEQQLSTVEGDIETYEQHQNELTSQVAFYTVTITLNPVYTMPATPQPTPWSVGGVFHDAFTASISFGEGLLTLLIWLLSFCIYLIPVVLLIVIIRRWGPGWRTQLNRSFAPATTAPKTAINDAQDE